MMHCDTNYHENRKKIYCHDLSLEGLNDVLPETGWTPKLYVLELQMTKCSLKTCELVGWQDQSGGFGRLGC